MLPETIRNYVLHGLRATPDVIERLLKDATAADYDRRPDPERFTIREVVAHLADWDPIWTERVELIARQDRPQLPDYDEGQLAIERDYAHADVAQQLARFRAGRERLMAALRDLPPEAWDRPGLRAWGEVTVATLMEMVLGHDGYHMKQICDWLAG